MGLTLTEARLLLRNIIRDELGSVSTDDDVNFTTESLDVYLGMGLKYAAKKEIEADPSRRLTTADIIGNAGAELINVPTGFLKAKELRVDNASSSGYTIYEKIDPSVRKEWMLHTATGYACYYTGTQIAVLPALATGEKAILCYYPNATTWTEAVATDLSDEACHIAVLKAAVYALAARGDNNVNIIKALLTEAEDDLYTIRQEDDTAEVVELDQTGTPQRGLPINITITES